MTRLRTMALSERRGASRRGAHEGAVEKIEREADFAEPEEVCVRLR